VEISNTSKQLRFKNVPTSSVVKLKNFTNFKSFVELLYELRNKIFHGEINFNDKNIELLCKQVNTVFRLFVGGGILPDR
jgi:hypothetical protein